ncbi:stage II sporulation protein R [Peptococcaceae bacterium 1198_IL3148]
MKYIKRFTVISFIVASLCAVSYYYCLQQEYAQELIRFHVIANSDSIEDQTLKLHVRDVVVNDMKQQFATASTKEEARIITEQNLDHIKHLAEQQIQKEGKDYQVAVMLGDYQFPKKTYGDLTLPAGNYEAVRVVIGAGKGQNWWCVLFPPLCFVDGVQNYPEGEKPKGVKVFEKNDIEFRMRSLELFK